MSEQVDDARLALGVAAASTGAFALFVLTPGAPVGLDLLWFLGSAAALFLGPVAAGLAGYVSVVALVRRTGGSARRLHLLSLAVATVFFAGLAFAWGSGVVVRIVGT